MVARLRRAVALHYWVGWVYPNPAAILVECWVWQVYLELTVGSLWPSGLLSPTYRHIMQASSKLSFSFLLSPQSPAKIRRKAFIENQQNELNTVSKLDKEILSSLCQFLVINYASACVWTYLEKKEFWLLPLETKVWCYGDIYTLHHVCLCIAYID